MKRHIGTHHFTNWKVFVFVVTIILGGILGATYSIQAYPEVFVTDVKIEICKDIGAADPVAIEFSQPISAEDYGEAVQVSPPTNVKLRWEDHNKKLVIIPEKFWKPETEYTLSLPEGKNVMFVSVSPQNLKFTTISFPRVKNITPESGAKNVMLDIEEPIVINFDKSTDGFFVKFVLDPSSNMSYQNNDEKTQFKLLPQEKAKDGENYKIKIYAKYAKDSDDGFQEIYESSFDTAPPAVVNWEKDYAARIEQAKKFTVPKITEGKYIDINISAQILSTFEDGKLLTTNMVSSGKRGMDTPKGNFNILTKRTRPFSKEHGLYMPWFMGFTTQGHGIHELPEWPGGYKEGAAHLGIPVSHGCVRLGVGPAKEIYDWAEVGTPIVIY